MLQLPKRSVGALLACFVAVICVADIGLADGSSTQPISVATAQSDNHQKTAALDANGGSESDDTRSVVDARVGGLAPLGDSIILSSAPTQASAGVLGTVGFPLGALAAACLGLCWLGRARATSR
jgi:hypothetical protein